MPFKFKTTIILATALAVIEAGIFLWPRSIQQFGQYDLVVNTPLNPKKVLVQTIPIEHNNLTSLVLYIGPAATYANGSVQISLRQGQETLYSTVSDSSAFTTNPFLPFDFTTILDSAHTDFSLVVSFPEGVNPAVLVADGTPINFFSIPQYEVHVWEKIPLLAQRININHGNLVPPGVTYVLLIIILWMSNLFLATASLQILEIFKSRKRSS